MTRPEVLARLQPVFTDFFFDDVVLAPHLTADDIEGWDSLAQISLVLAIEKEFGIRFRVGEVEATKNIGELADLIARRAAGQ